MAENDAQLATAFRDLEDEICKLRDMAAVTSVIIESHLNAMNCKIIDGYQDFHLSEADVSQIFFSVYDVDRRAKKLWTHYYAGFRDKPEDA